MATARLNSALRGVHGQLDQWVYKHYSYGTVITRRPRMENVIWSPAQKAHREQVRAAAAFYRIVVADPKLARRYQAIATRKRLPLSAVTMAEFFKQQRTTQARLASPAT